MPRHTKLDAKLSKAIVAGLKTGATVADVCAGVGIHRDTFYEWIRRGEAGETGFSDFSDAVTRAQDDAKRAAIKTLRTAMNPFTETQKVTKTFKETRLDRAGRPYEYARVEETKTTFRRQGDWRAAIEYLKRRHYDEWGDRSRVDSDWEAQALADIRAGRVTFAALAEAFGDDEAARLFGAAGAAPEAGTGAPGEPGRALDAAAGATDGGLPQPGG